jgi:putative membrane protein
MTRRTLIAAAAALALAGCGSERGGGDNLSTGEILPLPVDNGMASMNSLGNAAGPRASTGQEYVLLASASDAFEIQSSQLAIERAENDQVKEFARMLVADHQRSTDLLRQAAGEAQPPIQLAPPQLTPQQAQMIEGLRTAQGAAFDQLYLQGQVQAHQQTLAALQDYARSGDVPSLRQHASTVAGPVEQHLARARQLATQPQANQ